MINYEINIDQRHNIKLATQSPEKMATLLWNETIAPDFLENKFNFVDIEDVIVSLGLPDNLLVIVYDSDTDVEEMTIDTQVIDTEEKLVMFVEFIKNLHTQVHEDELLEILRINEQSRTCNIM